MRKMQKMTAMHNEMRNKLYNASQTSRYQHSGINHLNDSINGIRKQSGLISGMIAGLDSSAEIGE